MMTTRHNAHTAHGFSLVEVLSVLALMAVVAAAMLALAGSGRESARAREFVGDLQSTIQRVRDEFRPYDSYAPVGAVLNTNYAIARELVPESRHISAFVMRDPWGRAFALDRYPTTATQDANTQFAFTLTRPPDAVCIPMAANLLQMQPASFLQTAPSAINVATPSLRPTATAINGMAQTACGANTELGTGTWIVVFD